MMEEELQHTLDELCDDLLARETLAGGVVDATSTLQALVQLTLRFSLAQKALGRCLAASMSAAGAETSSMPLHQHKVERQLVPKLSVLAKRYLYTRETARTTIGLLAALASGNQRNQQRIVRSVTGVVVSRSATDRAAQGEARTTVFDAGKIKKKKTAKKNQSPELMLYILTVPDTVKASFRSWKKRYKRLQKCRLPSGVPPEQGGVPRPCYCDDCLGAVDQFLPTWQLHFQDLDRWMKDLDEVRHTEDEEALHQRSCSASNQQSDLVASDTFASFLQDYRVCTHNVVPEGDGGYREKATKERGELVNVYYFVKEVESLSAAPTATSAPAFDPLRHVCAIEITSDAVITATSRPFDALHTEHTPESGSKAAPESGGDNCTAYEAVSSSVLLLEDRVALQSCDHATTHMNKCDSPRADDVVSTDGVAECSARISKFLRQVQAASEAEQVTKDCIERALLRPSPHDNLQQEKLSEDRGDAVAGAQELAELDHLVLQSVLEYMNSSDLVSLTALLDIVSRHPCDVSLPRVCQAPSSISLGDQNGERAQQFHVQILARVDTEELEVRCTHYEDGESILESASEVFSATLTREEVLEVSERTSLPLELLCIEEDQLRVVLGRCRVCDCLTGACRDEDGVLYLLPQPQVAQDEGSLDVAPMQETTDQQTSSEERTRGRDKRTMRAVPGLSGDLAAAVVKLETLVRATAASGKATKSAFTTKFSESLLLLIKSCNTRVTTLANCARNDCSSIVPDAHRKAGLERCRHCRDLLIQLGKKAKLALDTSPQSKSDALTADQLERIAKLVRKTIAQVQAQSELVHPWETPDARVAKMHLDRRVWASGFPDPEFYREGDARELANKQQQRELTRRLRAKKQRQKA